MFRSSNTQENAWENQEFSFHDVEFNPYSTDDDAFDPSKILELDETLNVPELTMTSSPSILPSDVLPDDGAVIFPSIDASNTQLEIFEFSMEDNTVDQTHDDVTSELKSLINGIAHKNTKQQKLNAWNANTSLTNYFMGLSQYKNAKPISEIQLIEHFIIAMKSCSPDIYEVMWKRNHNLSQAVKNLADNELSNTLILSTLRTNSRATSFFIKNVLSFISRESLLYTFYKLPANNSIPACSLQRQSLLAILNKNNANSTNLQISDDDLFNRFVVALKEYKAEACLNMWIRYKSELKNAIQRITNQDIASKLIDRTLEMSCDNSDSIQKEILETINPSFLLKKNNDFANKQLVITSVLDVITNKRDRENETIDITQQTTALTTNSFFNTTHFFDAQQTNTSYMNNSSPKRFKK